MLDDKKAILPHIEKDHSHNPDQQISGHEADVPKAKLKANIAVTDNDKPAL